jgi:hypothetical protein
LSSFYKIKGEQVPRVTSVLDVIDKGFLRFWYASEERKAITEHLKEQLQRKGIGKQELWAGMKPVLSGSYAADLIARQAAGKGSKAHKAIENHLKHIIEPKKVFKSTLTLDENEQKTFKGWLKWWNASGLTPITMEKRVYHPELNYAGTMDLYAQDADGKHVVVDWKRSKRIYDEYALQNWAYRYAWEREGNDVDYGLIVRLDREGGAPEVKRVPEDFKVSDVMLMKCFEAALTLWRWKNPKHAG